MESAYATWQSAAEAPPSEITVGLVTDGRLIALAEWSQEHRYWQLEREDRCVVGEITHWLPLPELPKAESQ